nr:substrate-binding domain-containing protein [Propioniciclava coleopterorum]
MEAALARGIPVVISVMDPRPDIDHVAIDDVMAGVQLGEHLARLGHRDVAVLLNGGVHAPGTPDYVDNVDRLAGLRRGLGGASLRVHTTAENSYSAGRAAVGTLWDVRDRPTAVVALSDTMALGLMDGLAERGATAGRDVSLAGFDDIPEAAGRGLTTVHQPIEEKGRRVARLMLDPALEPRRVILPTRLVVRASTAPAPRA